MQPKRPQFRQYAWRLLRETFRFGEEATSKVGYWTALFVGALVLATGLLPVLARFHLPFWITPALDAGILQVGLIRAGYVIWASDGARRTAAELQWAETKAQFQARLDEALRGPDPPPAAPPLADALEVATLDPVRVETPRPGTNLGDLLRLELVMTDKWLRGIKDLTARVVKLERGKDGWKDVPFHSAPLFKESLTPGASRRRWLVSAWSGNPDGPGQFITEGNAIEPGLYRGALEFEAADFCAMSVRFGFHLYSRGDQVLLKWEDLWPLAVTPVS